MKADRRWWNDGRYEQECAAFDVAHPQSSETWDSLQRSRRESSMALALQPLHPDFINVRTEAGLEIRVKLRIDFPMHCGVAYL
jgi:hypothetical protein